MIRAFVFDLDGTLVDSLPGIADSLNRTLVAAGFAPHPRAAVRGFIGNGVAMLVRRALPDDPPEQLVDGLAEAFRADYAASWPAGSRPHPGAAEALAELASRNLPLAVWSNKPHPFTVDMVARLFPAARFAAVLGERRDVAPKPDPASVPDLRRALATPPHETAMVGDSLTDIKAARNAGMIAAAVTWGYHDRGRLAQAAPDHWIGRFGQLVELAVPR